MSSNTDPGEPKSDEDLVSDMISRLSSMHDSDELGTAIADLLPRSLSEMTGREFALFIMDAARLYYIGWGDGDSGNT